jgi:hypothetical protein
MDKYFSISGYWKEDPTDNFEDYLVKESTVVGTDEEDEAIFFYGLTEEEIKNSIEDGKNGVDEDDLEFVITSYSPTAMLNDDQWGIRLLDA